MTQEISKYDDVIDSRDVIARIEELEGLRRHWAAGWNMPGYMPDSEPAFFVDWDDARNYIAGEIDRMAEETEDETLAEEYGKAAEAVRQYDGGDEFGETVGAYHFWVSEAYGPQSFEDEDDAKEYATLKSLADEASGYAPDWEHGETLIRDSYFKEYAMGLAEDIGAINKDASWPNTCIDWEQAAHELQMDYTSVDFDGVTYWIR
jgi:hypothetical protein